MACARRVSIAVTASALILPASSSAAIPAAPLEAFRACAARHGAEDRFSGVVVVAQNGRPALQLSYGLADPASGRRNTPETPFSLASLGKMFTAVAIGQLVDRGRVRFDAPVGSYLNGLPPEVAAITIDQLLTHRSGLGDYARPENRSAILAARSATDLLPLALSGGLGFAPGSRQSYSNSGYVVLGAVIEAVTGLSYADYVQRNIFKPAGMSSATLDGRDRRAIALTSRSAGGAGGGGEAPGQRRPAPTVGGPRASPAGGAVGSALDLVRFGEALRRNRLVSAATRERLWSPHVRAGTTGGQTASYGYGFNRADAGREHVVGHGGGSLGVNSHFDFYPATGISVAVLSNYDPPAATDLLNASRRAFLTRAPLATICASPEPGAAGPTGGGAPGSTAPAAQAPPGSAEADVRALERRWLDAYETRDAAAMSAILADEFTITYPDGAVMTKSDVLGQLARMAGRPGARFTTESVEAQVSSDRVVLTGILVMQSPRGVMRSRYTDTWVRRAGRWQVVTSRLTAIAQP